jgi:hypothetical protein
MAAAPGRFLSSGTKWRPQAEPGGAAFPLPLGYLEIYGLRAPSCVDRRARLTCGRVAGAAGILTWDPGTACERGRPRASAGGTRPAAGPGRWRGTSEADESGARPPGGEEVCGPTAGCPTRATPRASLGPFVGLGSRGAVSRGIYGGGGGWAGGRLPAGEQRAGPEGAPPAQAWALARRRSEAEPAWAWGRNSLLFCSRGVGRRCLLPCCVVAPAFRRLSTRALCKRKGL